MRKDRETQLMPLADLHRSRLNRTGLPVPHRHASLGFTAIEIAMVATVIALLALIVLPLFRNRVEEAKIAAAKADLSSLQKAETLAQADVSFYLRLEDLDNTEGNPYSSATSTPPATGITMETPPFVYPPGPANSRQPLTLDQWRNLAGTKENKKFKGPYDAFQRHILYRDFKGDTALGIAPHPLAPYLLHSQRTVEPERAAIWDIPYETPAPGDLKDSPLNRIPIDPWGNPYMFFPATGETLYTNSVIYSLGPNGFPGDGTDNGNPAKYLRPDATVSGFDPKQWLGGDDDLMVQF